MRKSLSVIAAGATVLGLSALTTLPTFAAGSYTVSQADFDAAIAGTPTSGITCDDDGSTYWCILDGEYTLSGNVNVATPNDYMLYLNGNTTLDLGGHTLTGTMTNGTPGANVVIKNGAIANGLILPVGSTVTLSDITGTEIGIEPYSSTINILSGTYTTSSYNAPIYTGQGSTINISGGTFSTTLDTPVIHAINAGTATDTLNITGGTFTSGGFVAIDFANEPGVGEGPIVANIAGGTFTGYNAAINIMDPSYNTIALSGGTYSHTSTAAGDAGSIISWDGNTSTISGLLRSGYKYSNATIGTAAAGYAYVVDTSVVPESTDDGGSTDENTDSTEGTTTPTSPDSGVSTSEGASATAAGGLMTAVILSLIGAGALATRRF